MKARSTLFLMEQLVAIVVFAICAAICVKILFTAHQKTVDAVDTRNALTHAESIAEHFKADGLPVNQNEIWYYDADWRLCAEYNCYFIVTLNIRETESITYGDINAARFADSRELIGFTVARRVTQ